MSHLLKSAALVNDLLEMRDTMRKFLGEKYEERIEPYKNAIRKRCEDGNYLSTTISLAAAMSQREPNAAFNTVLLLSAGVDLATE